MIITIFMEIIISQNNSSWGTPWEKGEIKGWGVLRSKNRKSLKEEANRESFDYGWRR